MTGVRRRSGASHRLLIACSTVVVLVVALAMAVFLKNNGDEESQLPEPIFEPVPMTLAPGVHMLGALNPSVAYVIETDQGLILIDAGMAEAHSLLLKQFQSLGLEIKDLTHILLTHGHGDHFLGAAKLQELTGAKLHVGKGDSEILRESGPREAVFSTFGGFDHIQIHPTTPDVELAGGEVFEFGGVRIEVIAAPGHTPGSMCYLMTKGSRTALFSGDTVMTIQGDLGTYATRLPPRYRGNAHDYLATLKKLSELPVPDLLLPGHPESYEGFVSARLSQSEWEELLGDGIREMETLSRRYSEDGADFLDGEAKELLPGLFYLGDLAGRAVYCLSQDSSAVVFGAPGGEEFAEFLKVRLDGIGSSLSAVKAIVVTGTDEALLSGLGSLADQAHIQVVAAESIEEQIRTALPEGAVIQPEALRDSVAWFEVEAIPVDGFGGTETAYHLKWADKTVLVTGSVPLKFEEGNRKELEALRLNPTDCMRTLEQFGVISPDLWLPARPAYGQNANLYNTEWSITLRECHMKFLLRF